MPRIQFIESSGAEHSVEAEAGSNLMVIATSAVIPGIVADCGGNCSCATCHVYIDDAFLDSLSEKSSMEGDMLECAFDPQPNSRLACQVTLGEDMDNMVIRIPERQF